MNRFVRQILRFTRPLACNRLHLLARRACGVAAMLLVLVLGGCDRHGDLTVIKLGHSLDGNHPVHKAMVFMGERLAEKSGGTMRLDIYPSQQLGSERETLELLQIGSLGMTKVSSSVIEGFVPEFRVFGLAYLFRDDAHRFNVLDGNVGEELLLTAQPYGLRGLAYYDAGSRSFYTKQRPIMTPADLQGLKIRTQESPVAIRMIQALGGSATPIAWGELYTALQQGVVDGAENNPPSFYTSRHYEVAPYFVLDEHTAVPDVLFISTTIWNTLTPQQQAWVQEAADESVVYQRELWKEAEEEALAAVREAGVEVIEPDKAAFEAKVHALYESFRSESVVYDLIQKIKEVE